MGAGAGVVAGIVGGAVGSVFSTIGAFGQLKQAKKQQERGRIFRAGQQNQFKEGYADLESLLANQSTYKADTSEYTRTEEEARKQQVMATQANPADQIMRDQARQSSSNYIDQASRGARSGVDLMSIAGMGAMNESSQMQGINIQSANQRMSMEQRANDNLLNTLSQTAAATARERGMEFNSVLGKQQDQLSLRREGNLGLLDLENSNFNANQANAAAVQNAKASIWSGVGDTFRAIGGGIAQSNMQKAQMDYMKSFGGT